MTPPPPLANPTRTSTDAVARAGMNNPTVVAALFDEARSAGETAFSRAI